MLFNCNGMPIIYSTKELNEARQRQQRIQSFVQVSAYLLAWGGELIHKVERPYETEYGKAWARYFLGNFFADWIEGKRDETAEAFLLAMLRKLGGKEEALKFSRCAVLENVSIEIEPQSSETQPLILGYKIRFRGYFPRRHAIHGDDQEVEDSLSWYWFLMCSFGLEKYVYQFTPELPDVGEAAQYLESEANIEAGLTSIAIRGAA